MLLAGAGPATAPSESLKALGQRAEALRVKYAAAESAYAAAAHAAEMRYTSSPAYQAAEAQVASTEKALEAARESGTPQERLDASSAFNRARAALNALKAAGPPADPAIDALRRKRDSALNDYAPIRDHLDSLQKEQAAEAKVIPIPPARRGDALITVEPFVGTIRIKSLDGVESGSSDAYFVLGISIQNVGGGKKVEYSTWSGKTFAAEPDSATVTDDLGTAYRHVGFGSARIVGATDDASIEPGKSVTDIIVFQAPADKAGSFDVEFPGANIGSKEPIKLHITRDMFVTQSMLARLH